MVVPGFGLAGVVQGKGYSIFSLFLLSLPGLLKNNQYMGLFITDGFKVGLLGQFFLF